MRGRKWGVVRRPVRRYALGAWLVTPSEAPVQAPTPAEHAAERERYQLLEVTISPNAGSHALEQAFLAQVPLFPGPPGVAFHDADSRRNPEGLPDIVAVVGGTLYLLEMKGRRATLTAEQARWQEALAGVERVVYGVVTPAQWPEVLRGIHVQAFDDTRGAPA